MATPSWGWRPPRSRNTDQLDITHEWIGGTTSGFNWNVFDIDPLGWRLFRMPVTLRGDFWVYLTDFTLANSVDDLPTYSSY